MTGLDGRTALCILVIDDNRDAADVLGMLLRTLGHQAHVAHGGDTALEQIAALRPDLILLDLGMPRIDGYEIARRVRQNALLAATRIVAVTGYADERRRALALEAGFDDYMVKPIHLADLQAMTKRADETLALLRAGGNETLPSR